MVNKKKKRIALGVVIISLVFLNIFQSIKISKYENDTQDMNNEFKIGLDMVCIGIEEIEEAKRKKSEDEKVLATTNFAAGTEKLNTVYRYTDYFEKNGLLYSAVSKLNNLITNNLNINNLLNKHNFTPLIPMIKALRENPLDKEATKNLYHYLQYIEY